MHRDLKLGFALAVLLIGSTTAFFFRCQTDPEAGLPQLQDPERLDHEIARREIAPYLGQPESEEIRSKLDPTPWVKPAFLNGSSRAVAKRATVTPDPIQLILEEDSELLGGTPSGGGMELIPAQVGPDTPPYHVVRAGDTLTGLATKYLGNLARYSEIFELNRDQLKAADDLRVGMKLRLPQAAARKDDIAVHQTTVDETIGPADSGTETHAIAADELETASGTRLPGPRGDDSGKMFVPATKTPFIPRQYRAPTTAAPGG